MKQPIIVWTLLLLMAYSVRPSAGQDQAVQDQPGQNQPGQNQSNQSNEQAAEPRMDGTDAGESVEIMIQPEADEALRSMGYYLSSLRRFQFVTENTVDVIDENGQKIQLTHNTELLMHRPNRIHGSTTGDGNRNREFWFDGKNVSILHHLENVYSQVETPGNIDDMLDVMNHEYGVTIPTADLLFSNAYESLSSGVRQGRLVGLSRVGDTLCRHLAFQQEFVDWQIWIDAGPTPLPRKFVVTYKMMEGSPQFAARFHKWDTNPAVEVDGFNFVAPHTAHKVDMLPVTTAMDGTD